MLIWLLQGRKFLFLFHSHVSADWNDEKPLSVFEKPNREVKIAFL